MAHDSGQGKLGGEGCWRLAETGAFWIFDLEIRE
jgi:hypothetical protein